jgi:hypothetical protein
MQQPWPPLCNGDLQMLVRFMKPAIPAIYAEAATVEKEPRGSVLVPVALVPGGERPVGALTGKPVAEWGEIPEALGCETLLLGQECGILFGEQV